MRCPIVVGRDVELSELAAAIDGAAAGAGRCVLISGEAGIGKSRLVGEAAAAARGCGHATLLGRSSPTDQVSPLRPLAEALLGALRDRERPDDPGLRPYLPALGTQVPHWADWDRELTAVPPAPVVLGEAVLRVLRVLAAARAGASAAVLVVEDLHWADRETLAVLEYLADHVADIPVVLVLTVRSDEPATARVEAMFAAATLLRPAPLGEPAVAAMAAACLGVPTAPAELLGWLQRAGGLPLVVEDLVTLDGQPGRLRYAEIVSRRLGGLDPTAREVVNAAAVLGNEVDAELLAAVTGLSDGSLAAALGAAARNMLLIPAGHRLAFRHALTRELVLAALRAPARAALCRTAADILESSTERDAVSGRLGELWAQAGDTRRAAEAFRRAARRARVAGATSTAESLLGSALAGAPPELVGPLRLELLELLAVAGRIGQLTSLGALALDDLAHDADLTAAVRLLLGSAKK